MREMGNRAGVPIEPPEQTALLDACKSQAGVIGCGVPGGTSLLLFRNQSESLTSIIICPAGGYDAVWVLVLDPPDSGTDDKPLNRVEQVWASWKGLDVSPLSATESFDQGLRLERAEDVPGLQEILSS